MRVEIAYERFGLLPKFSGDSAGVSASAEGLNCPVAWPKADLSSLSGRTVRLRIHLSRGEYPEPRLYAAYLTCE
ncbi:MAG: hypothetical protein HY318_08920 [Armatimonadetes bacterium]|nr:hypothetical protein [Armatimonadota bacterium]